jgi:hypothetical protein
MNSAWTRRTDKPFPRENHRQFRANCLGYGQAINEKYYNWCKANGDESEKSWVDREMFNPMSFYTLDHGDDACIVLIDDHLAIHHLTTRFVRRLEDVSVANCLRMKELVESAGLTSVPFFFVEPHDLFDIDKGPKPFPFVEQHSCDAENTQVHSIQRKIPFLTFAKLRMDGLAVLGHFLLAQQAIYKAMVRSVVKTIADLDKFAKNASCEILTLDDIQETRCCFVDIEGIEEIGALIFCNNLTVAFSILANLRRLRYADIFAVDDELRGVMEEDKILKLLIEKGTTCTAPNAESFKGLNPIKGSHVFRWTTTSVRVAPHVLETGDRSSCRGKVEASLCVRTPPGHEHQAQQILDDVLSSSSVSSDIANFYVVGKYDIIRPLGIQPLAPDQGRVEFIEKVLKDWDNAHVFMSKRMKGLGLDGDEGRICSELELQLQVYTVPVSEDPPEVPRHSSPLLNVLTKIHQELCEPNDAPHLTPEIGEPKEFTQLELKALFHFNRFSGMPVHLRQNVERLFHSFFNALSNPYEFDLVLDLVDVFLALHRTICDALPNMLNSYNEKYGTGLRILDEETIQQIVEFVSAIENALQHRVGKIFPIENAGDMAIDLRGGLNQAIMAAHAAMASSVGVFRRCVLGPQDTQRNEDRNHNATYDSRSALGVVNRISLSPGLRCHVVRLGFEKNTLPQLAWYEIDVPHLLHPASYVDYMHETGHLIFWSKYEPLYPFNIDEQLQPLKESLESSDSRTRGRAALVRERLSEIFALSFAHILILGTEREQAIPYYVSTFARSLAAVGKSPPDDDGNTDPDTIVRYTEFMFRLYILYIFLPNEKQDVCTWLKRESQKKSPNDALKDFLLLFEKMSRFLPDYDRIFVDSNQTVIRNYQINTFNLAYLGLAPYLNWLWSTLKEIILKYYEDSTVLSTGDSATQEFVEQQIKTAFKDGTPLVRSKIDMRLIRTAEQLNSEGQSYDSYLNVQCLISELLRLYVTPISDAAEGQRKVVAVRESAPGFEKKKGQVFFAKLKGKEKWHELLIDRGTVPLFCPVPSERKKRTRKQIVIRKTLRDIASALQSRRLELLIRGTPGVMAPESK